MNAEEIERIVELGLLSSDSPCTERKLATLFEAGEKVSVEQIREALGSIAGRMEASALELCSTASGWQLRSRERYKERLQRFLESTRPRLSRPMYEVLAIVAYHQPATRGEIEEIRGVTTSAGQIAMLEELGWIEVSGRKETPGRPLLYSTTPKFLDDIGLMKLEDLPPIESFADELEGGIAEIEGAAGDGGEPSSEQEATGSG